MKAIEGKRRVVIDNISPRVDEGQYAIKRCIGEIVRVNANIFTDGQPTPRCILFYKHASMPKPDKIVMTYGGNDTWQASFHLLQLGFYSYYIVAWVNEVKTRTPFFDILVEPHYAFYSAWYEVFPRSLAKTQHQHGTFKDLAEYMPNVKAMGFDIIYLPPIHPIGVSARKGKNNLITATPEDVGSPWAIGNKDGGHMSIHAELGSLDDFRNLVKKARINDIKVALDYALQCSPDHPYIRKHPSWFRFNPDGTIRYAENPPKKYEDIVPFNFDSNNWRELWLECLNILLFWIKEDIKIFRVDNPHTKPFVFWQWLIKQIKMDHPEVIFLSESFTRPCIMHHLAKIGFTQSYTYFTWRNNKQELTKFMEEMIKPPMSEYFIPNLWPNTPDILSEYLQQGGKPAFVVRLMLAATLGTNYGIYGPAYDYCINLPISQNSEEYLNSDKYELKYWPLNHPKQDIKDSITKINSIRQSHSALHNMHSLQFHSIENPEIICYSKVCHEKADNVLVAVNLDYQHKQTGYINLDLERFSIKQPPYYAFELLTNTQFTWSTGHVYIELDPTINPVQIFHLKNY